MMDSSVKGVAGKRVFVGLSGGVDSAVTAALLQRAGADVTGVFIKGWYPPGMPCTWAADRRDAMRVAAHLGIPFYTLDASEEYKRGVIDYLLAEYAAGRTPNPDVMCNREVKFGAFARFAKGRGADCIATGHYARVERIADGAGVDAHTSANGITLLRGTDPAKDQSYFLWAVPGSALSTAVFPLGGMEKDETRALARALKLPVAAKRDSQGICFLGSVSVEDFLRAEFDVSPGIARDERGNEVGEHSGAIVHTIGERIALRNAAPGPWYVVAKDVAANQLTVAHAKRAPETRSVRPAAIKLTETNWFSSPDAAAQLAAQYRYHGPLMRGALSTDRTLFVPSQPPDEAIAAGQSLVIYDGDRVVGGGIIAE